MIIPEMEIIGYTDENTSTEDDEKTQLITIASSAFNRDNPQPRTQPEDSQELFLQMTNKITFKKNIC